MNRGFWGIGIYRPKTETNVGTLWRSAVIFGASFVFTIGRRYRKQSSDTLCAAGQVPCWNFTCWDDFKEHVPLAARVVCVELAEKARLLDQFIHPPTAIYLLGAEDHGLPRNILEGQQVVQVPSARPLCLNVATAGSIVMYDRFIKGG